MDGQITVGILAIKTGIPPKTIRYYESIGLIPPPPRTTSRYRVYSDKDVRRLELIRRAKFLNLSLSQIGELVQWAAGDPWNAFQGHLLGLMTTKLKEVDGRIQDLTLLRGELEQLVKSLTQGDNREEQEDHTVMECPSCQCFGGQATLDSGVNIPSAKINAKNLKKA